MSIITFLSDFGVKDSYVGTVKGILLSINPSVRIIDISHDVANFDIKSAAYQLSCYYKFYPAGTIHMAVVDPGVGGKRQPLIIKTNNHIFVGPDNGLFSAIIRDEDISCYIINPNKFNDAGIAMAEVSNTFHARDIFAPVAAYLSGGGKVPSIARKKPDPPQCIEPQTVITDSTIVSGISNIDQFGNIITEIQKSDLKKLMERNIAEIRFKDYIFKNISATYKDVAPGAPLVLWGSNGRLEISVNMGNARQLFKANQLKDTIHIKLY